LLFLNSSNALECIRNQEGDVKVISDDRINDGFCDCPYDSLDETKTEACSGSTIGGWPGISEQMDRSPTFECPQQTTLQLPLSRLNDGVCDCCDGADEIGGICDDNCEEVLAFERAERAAVVSHFQTGSLRRSKELSDYTALVKVTLQEIQKLEDSSTSKQHAINQLHLELEEEKEIFTKKRRSMLKEIITTLSFGIDTSTISGLLSPLTTKELTLLMQLTCQIAGEIMIEDEEEKTEEEGKTCVPLRLAGVDVGILWEDENYTDAIVERFDDGTIENLVIQLLDENSNETNNKQIWSKD